MADRVTLQTLAEALGVSRTTVSNAYNRPDQLAPALRERILAAARELGYPGPDPAARRLRAGRRDPLGVLLGGSPADPAAGRLLEGLARGAGEAGLLLVPAAAVGDAVVGGLCLNGLAEDDPAVAAVLARGLPLVTVGEPRLDGVALLRADDRAGARAAAAHLRELGHRRVAEVGGWADAAALLAAAPRPTAVVAASDEVALAVAAAAREAGLRVPGDLSVVGWGDTPAAAAVGLTSRRPPLAELGERAARLLAEGAPAREVVLPVELVVRRSTAPPR